MRTKKIYKTKLNSSASGQFYLKFHSTTILCHTTVHLNDKIHLCKNQINQAKGVQGSSLMLSSENNNENFIKTCFFVLTLSLNKEKSMKNYKELRSMIKMNI